MLMKIRKDNRLQRLLEGLVYPDLRNDDRPPYIFRENICNMIYYMLHLYND